MEYSLTNLKRPKSAKHGKKRVGRGNASGKGTYAGRGMKGQKSRSGGRRRIDKRAIFQQLLIRTPKLPGFKRRSKEIAIINLSDLDDNFNDNEKVTIAALAKKGLIHGAKGGVKVLANGIIKKKLNVQAHYFSAQAKEAIEKAGGTAQSILKEVEKGNSREKRTDRSASKNEK